ncbi:MAG: hypothetical protein C5B56_15980, partial [Proteobacteria bacterium]
MGESNGNGVRETSNLIGSDKVEGTAVFGADSRKIGTIERVMIDKISGRVSYAVLGFGGFLGIGSDHYPLPWQSLKYDTQLGGYVAGVTESELRGAPKYGNDNDWNCPRPSFETPRYRAAPQSLTQKAVSHFQGLARRRVKSL